MKIRRVIYSLIMLICKGYGVILKYSNVLPNMKFVTLVNKSSDYATFSLCICDIDFFKRVNDNYGHDFDNDLVATIKEADGKLYMGKEQGRDRIIY